MARVYNPTPGPLPVDRRGHVVGSHEHRDDVDVTRRPARLHVEAGRLLVVDEPATEPDAEQPAEVEQPAELEAPARRRATATPSTPTSPEA